MHENDSLIGELLAAGARGYLLKSDDNHSLLAAIEALGAHKPYFTAKVSEALLGSFLAKPGQPQSSLTPRERGVVQLIAEGHSNKHTSKVMNINVKTVETYRAAVMRKLNLSSSASLVRYAIRNRLVGP